MAFQLSVAARNAGLDAYETAIGTDPVLEIRSGSLPANCAAADSGTVLGTLALPTDWLAAASSGAKAKSGTWSDPAADNSGTAGHFRIKSSGGTCHMQGDITVTGGGGAMTLVTTTIVASQPIQIDTFTLTAGNA